MPTSSDDVAHLLRRAGFGGRAAEIAALTSLDRAALVDHVLDITNAPAADAPAEFADGNMSNWEKFSAMGWWWYDRMATSPTPIVEKMTLFWHGHFTSSYDSVTNFMWLFDQNQLFRRLALGDMRQLTQEMAVQPAMLQYLDNRSNTKRGPQQNFARELMELFTMGVGNYSETDVSEAARAWTGHTIGWPVETYTFNANNHDTGSKTIFGVTKNWDGPDVVDAIFTMPVPRAAVASYMARKLWTFFAYPDPSPSLVAALATVFENANFDVSVLLRAIFLRNEFWSPAAKWALVRSPTEYIVAALRGTGMTAAQVHPEWFSSRMGQALFYPPNVAGWKNNKAWLGTSAVAARADFADTLNYRLDQLDLHPLLAPILPDASIKTPDQLVDIVLTLLDVSVSTGTRTALRDWVVRTRAGLNRWTISRMVILVFLVPEFHVA